MRLRDRLSALAKAARRDAVALWFAVRDPATPLAARLLIGFIVAYALSPIDLIPDFLPLVGYLDEALLLPALVWLALKMLPPLVLAASRDRAERWFAERRARPHSRWGAVIVVSLWALAIAAALWWVLGRA